MAPRYFGVPREYLTATELRVLSAVANGCSNAEIAERLGVHEETVKRHLRTLRWVLGARDRAHAVHLAWQRGYFGPARVPASVQSAR